MSRVLRWALAVGVALVVVAAHIYLYRCVYAYNKRLREIDPGRVYRSGQLSADGFADAVDRFRFRTIVNLQDDYPDPDVDLHFWGGGTIKETELCRRLGVRYVLLKPDLVPLLESRRKRPATVDDFLELMDDPDVYPVLLHCKAGLHRTGCLSAVYRMEYQGWTPDAAYAEMKELGFGDWACTSANDYVSQYVLNYRRGQRRSGPQKLTGFRLHVATCEDEPARGEAATDGSKTGR
jgi:tyrosine-protein phosphatase SIW14